MGIVSARSIGDSADMQSSHWWRLPYFSRFECTRPFLPQCFPWRRRRALPRFRPMRVSLRRTFFGGYLIYRFNGARKVFFDGRSDFYGAEFMKRYVRMVQVRPGWREEFSGWNFTHALLPADHSLIPALEASGWTELHRDSTAVLLAERIGALMDRRRILILFGAAWISAALLTWFLYAKTVVPTADKRTSVMAAAHDLAVGTMIRKADLKKVSCAGVGYSQRRTSQ